MASSSDGPAHALREAANHMRQRRGHARQLRRVFHRSMLPMVMVDNDRRQLSSNRAARLLLRLSAEELRGLSIDDLTPPEQLSSTHAAWERLMRDGEIVGTQDLALGEVQLGFTYCALARILPGEHLIVFAPSEWPDEEVGVAAAMTPAADAAPLTPREREVLTLIAAGLDFGGIAAELTISPSTVKSHVRNSLTKLGARNRPHAIALAMKAGLIDLPLD